MRIRKCQCLLTTVLVINIIALYYFWKTTEKLEKFVEGDDESDAEASRHDNRIIFNEHLYKGLPAVKPNLINELVTVIIREFEDFDNDVADTVRYLSRIFPTVRILIITDKRPYPPLQLSKNRHVKLIVLHGHPEKSYRANRPEYFIKTPFVLFLPDSVRVSNRANVDRMIARSDESVVIAKISGESFDCQNTNVKLKEWTLSIDSADGRQKRCNYPVGRHLTLVPSLMLLNLSEPFARPFPVAFYIQAAIRGWKVEILNDDIQFQPGKPLFDTPHFKWKHESFEKQRLNSLFESFGIKKVEQIDGKIDYYGCSKHTLRCFGSVIDDMPEYLYENRWTPPCCLDALRKTAKHVLRILTKFHVRHWLEGGSLLGAARNGDIIPWDYDVDIGIYREDIKKCPFLSKIGERSMEDEDGFVWEKATEGDFYRVQYSKTNHMHVDIFPFYSRNGIMTKDVWFKTHRQDMEFPESYLRPITTINFLGIQASAPNNIRDFLELKFGEAVIENPKYPNPDKLTFPNNSVYFSVT